MIYMFLSSNPSSGDINSSNLSCSGEFYSKAMITLDMTIFKETR